MVERRRRRWRRRRILLFTTDGRGKEFLFLLHSFYYRCHRWLLGF